MKLKVTEERGHMRHRDRPGSLGSVERLTSQEGLLIPKRILVPIDFSPTSLRTLRSAIPFAQRFGAGLCVMHVIERVEYPDHHNAARTVQESALMELAREHLMTVVQTEVGLSVCCEAHVRMGRPFLEIIAFARLHEVDLIIIAPYGESPVRQSLLGSTAEKVLHHAQCPVLALHDREELGTLERSKSKK